MTNDDKMEVKSSIDQWIQIMRLEDWDFQLEFKASKDMPEEDLGKLVMNTHNHDLKVSKITWTDAWDKHWAPMSIRRIVIHELLHTLLPPEMSKLKGTSISDKPEEVACHLLSRALERAYEAGLKAPRHKHRGKK